jgi:hypothetical protein
VEYFWRQNQRIGKVRSEVERRLRVGPETGGTRVRTSGRRRVGEDEQVETQRSRPRRRHRHLRQRHDQVSTFEKLFLLVMDGVA